MNYHQVPSTKYQVTIDISTRSLLSSHSQRKSLISPPFWDSKSTIFIIITISIHHRHRFAFAWAAGIKMYCYAYAVFTWNGNATLSRPFLYRTTTFIVGGISLFLWSINVQKYLLNIVVQSLFQSSIILCHQESRIKSQESSVIFSALNNHLI